MNGRKYEWNNEWIIKLKNILCHYIPAVIKTY